MNPPADLISLTALLERRLAIIADHAWRDKDPPSHLEALKDVSQRIAAWTARNQGQLDGRLKHFLANSSFEKALAHALSLAAENDSSELPDPAS
jgi:hypothetical protein